MKKVAPVPDSVNSATVSFQSHLWPIHEPEHRNTHATIQHAWTKVKTTFDRQQPDYADQQMRCTTVPNLEARHSSLNGR